MNRLWIRLTLAFIVVTQFSIFVVAALADSSVNGEFRQYVIQRDTSELGGTAQRLTVLYNQSGGTWAGVEKVMTGGTVDTTTSQAGPIGFFWRVAPGSESAPYTAAVPAGQPQRPLLADAQGKVVYDPTGAFSG